MFYMTQITVRDVDKDVFREFKAEATRQGMKVGSALTLAMLKFKSDLRKKKKLTLWEPVDWGPGNEHVSEQVDDIMYGEK